MTSNCPWRKLEADGTVLTCQDHPFGDPDQHVSYDRQTAWTDGDPCAWDATCSDCDGLSTRSPTSNPGRSAPCGTCDGAGTVDTIPARLIGEGTRLRHCDHDINGWGDVILIARDEYGDWFARPVEAEPNGGYLRIGDRHIGNEYEWRVLRAVPPAGDTT